MQELLKLKVQHPAARLVAGHNEIGIERKYNQTTPSMLISISDIPELCKIQVSSSSHATSHQTILSRYGPGLWEVFRE